MDDAGLDETHGHAGRDLPRARRRLGPLREWHGVAVAALAVAAAYVVLAVGAPWLLEDAPPSLYEIVAARACAPGAPGSSPNASAVKSAVPSD